MHRPVLVILAAALACASGVAGAQSPGYAPADPYLAYDPYSAAPRDAYGSPETQYDQARVLRVDPVFDGGRGTPTSQQRCYSRDDYYSDGGGAGYGDPYGDDPWRQDGRNVRGNDNARTVATVVGGVVGAVLGSKVGDGSGRYATSALGTMVGGMAGREIYEATQRNRVERQGRVTVCDPVPVAAGGGYGDAGYGGVAEYDVTYEYAGRRYTTRTNYHPGDTIRVRVDVRPD